jgi:hypothetical protein
VTEKPKRGGRPPLDPDDPSVDVHVRLPSKQYDAVYRLAQHARVTVPEMFRRGLENALRDDPIRYK